MGNMYYGDGTNKRLLSGIAQVPRLTLAQYQALTVKPRFWVRTDAPETYNQLLTWDDQAELGSKNIIKYPYAYGGGTTHGLTVTVNADGSVTASGQPNQAIGWVMITNIITEYDLQVGDKLIFSEHEVNNNNASAALTYVNPTSLLSLVQGDYELTVTSEMVTKGVSFILWFNNGVNLSTPITFKPMVRLTSCSDSTWASPALTNRKLTELVTYINEVKIKQLEVGVASASTATGTEYSSGVSVKTKIDDMETNTTQSVAFSNAKLNNAYTLRFEKVGKIVELKTTLYATSDIAPTEVIGTAPVGYRPTTNVFGNTKGIDIDIAPDGTVSLKNTSSPLGAGVWYVLTMVYIV